MCLLPQLLGHGLRGAEQAACCCCAIRILALPVAPESIARALDQQLGRVPRGAEQAAS